MRTNVCSVECTYVLYNFCNLMVQSEHMQVKTAQPDGLKYLHTVPMLQPSFCYKIQSSHIIIAYSTVHLLLGLPDMALSISAGRRETEIRKRKDCGC